MIIGEQAARRPPRPNPPLPQQHPSQLRPSQSTTNYPQVEWDHSQRVCWNGTEKDWEHQQQLSINHQHHSPSFFPQQTPQQFFSDIDKPLFEEDSLFDAPESFLAPPEPMKQSSDHHPFIQEQCQAIYRENQSEAACKKRVKTSCDQTQGTKSSQILKERTYAYRKDRDSNPKQIKGAPRQFQRQNKKQGRSVSATNLRPGEKIVKQVMEDEEKSKEGGVWERTGGQGLPLEEYLLLALERSGIDNCNKSQSRLSHCRKGFDSQDIKECTFKPSILKKSQELIKNKQPVVERLSVSQARSTKRLPYQPNQSKSRIDTQRLQRLSQPRKSKIPQEERQEETPSFWPALSKKSLQHMSNCTLDVATRNQLWLEQKQAKIDRLKQEDEEYKAKKDNCTYTPALTNYRGQQDANFSRFGRQGMVEYFQRVKKRPDQEKPGQSRLSTEADSGRNKQNSSSWGNSSKVDGKGKKQTYQQAVRDLHSKIMKLNI